MTLARKIALALVALTLPGLVSAKPIYKKADWSLEDTGDLCLASTTGTFNRQKYALTVVLDKTGGRPLELLMLPYQSPATASLFQVKLSDDSVYSFAAMPTAADGRDSFWNVPRSTDVLIAAMKRGNRVTLDSVIGEKGSVAFSLIGVTATLGEMDKRCVQANKLDSADFERRFVPAQAATLDATKLTSVSTDYLHGLIEQAVTAYRGILAIEAELAALEVRYAKITNELGLVNQDLALQNQNLTRSTAARNAATVAIDQANADIASLQAAIARDQQGLADAKLEYDAASQRLAPYIPRHDDLLAQLNRARSNTSSAQANVNAIERSISAKNQEISALEQEQRSLWNQQPSLRAQVDQALRARDNADRAYRNFDVQNEIFLRQRNNARLQQIERDIGTLNTQIGPDQQAVRQAERRKNQAAQALQDCRGSNAVPDPADSVGLTPGKGKRPKDPGPGPEPTPDPIPDPGPIPDPTPAPDCSRERQTFQQAKLELEQAQGQLDRDQNALQNRTADRNQILRQIEDNVNADYNQLRQNANWANQEYNRLASQESAVESRLLQIQSQLQSRNSELNQLVSQRSQAQGSLQRAEQQEQTARASLDSFERSVNYAVLKADVANAKLKVGDLQSQIALENAQIVADQKKITEQTAVQTSMQSRIDAANLKIAADQTRIGELQVLLQPYDAEKNAITQRLITAQQALELVKADFAANLPQ